MGDTTARTMRFQKPLNRLMRSILAAPGISRGIGRRLITLYIVGRTSGRRMSVPVAYTRSGDVLLIGTPFAWGRNLRTGEPIEVRHLGRRRTADVRVFTEEADVVRRFAVMCRDNRNFAAFNGIGRDGAGEPDPADLHRAWAGGARAFELTLR